MPQESIHTIFEMIERLATGLAAIVAVLFLIRVWIAVRASR
jgi:heme A synthase